MKHLDLVTQQFGTAAADYLTSTVHAQGEDLSWLEHVLENHRGGRVLDLGCGGGHASYRAAAVAGEVCAYDASGPMLTVVAEAARNKGLGNIRTQQGMAEKLPFADVHFDAVVSRLSAHHWRNVPQALLEAKRVLAKTGTLALIDIAGHDDPLLDSHLQAVELLRDPSHVRDYTEHQWLAMLGNAGFSVIDSKRWRMPIEFNAWIARMRTPADTAAAILRLWKGAPAEVRDYYAVQEDGSFQLDALMLVARLQLDAG